MSLRSYIRQVFPKVENSHFYDTLKTSTSELIIRQDDEINVKINSFGLISKAVDIERKIIF